MGFNFFLKKRNLLSPIRFDLNESISSYLKERFDKQWFENENNILNNITIFHLIQNV